MNKKYSVLIALLLVTVLTVACAQAPAPAPAPEPTPAEEPAPTTEPTPDPTPEALAGRITVVGSTSVAPTIERLAAEFMANVEPGIEIEVQSVGSSAGVRAAIDGTADIGMASRELKDEEKESGINEYILGFDGIAVANHPSNPVNDLTPEQVQAIFAGQITNWSEVGGDDVEIIVVSREEGSGTRGAFEELMGLDGDVLVTDDAVIAEGNGAVKAQIASKEDAIGYLSLSYLDDSVQDMLINGVEVSPENILAGSYTVSRPFLLLTDGDLNEVVQSFFDFFGTETGRQIIRDMHLIIQ